MAELQPFLHTKVGVTIYDEEWEDKTPPIPKKIQKLAICPDGTHLRIYFDEHRFFAVPHTSKVTVSEREWIAFDQMANLHYVIRKA
ncbi:hypothetical protein KHA95_14250 [Bacillus sp. FJAT-50079]|nr:hypothetical protein [Bacillus sp. FJAT-50079]MBS4209221.1 hypothetical protein [Bacillus sp. FJAT-50079]